MNSYRLIKVSVSTSGSKGVQRDGTHTPSWLRCEFQYPQADRRGCNCWLCPAVLKNSSVSVSTSGSKGVQLGLRAQQFCCSAGFSIHKRIEGGATSRRSDGAVFLYRFQYPQADRRGCNLALSTSRRSALKFQYPQADRRGCNGAGLCSQKFSSTVSVSTSGSKGVQRTTFTSSITMNTSFSIHKRIEGGATEIHSHCQCDYPAFQYPQADRRGCNGGFCVVWTARRCVSVSTSGSKGVQPIWTEITFVFAFCFSIHKRIEGGATIKKICRRDTTSRRFSIHKRIEGGATSRRSDGAVFLYKVSVSTSGSKGVQPFLPAEKKPKQKVSVSTSGSKGVQPGSIAGGMTAFTSFSIHKRIEGGATLLGQYPASSAQPFQYPQADRRGCNQNQTEELTKKEKVSVSTSGSKGVQPAGGLDCRWTAGVSVSTSGSKGVQLHYYVRLAAFL